MWYKNSINSNRIDRFHTVALENWFRVLSKKKKWLLCALSLCAICTHIWNPILCNLACTRIWTVLGLPSMVGAATPSLYKQRVSFLLLPSLYRRNGNPSLRNTSESLGEEASAACRRRFQLVHLGSLSFFFIFFISWVEAGWSFRSSTKPFYIFFDHPPIEGVVPQELCWSEFCFLWDATLLM